MIDPPTPLQRDIEHWLTAWTPEKLLRTSPAIREAVALLRRVHDEQRRTPMIDPPTPTAAIRELADTIVQEVAELPDRDSPDGWPEAMLVTADELRAIIEERAAGVLAASERSRAQLRAALVKVRAHTGYTIPASGKSADLVALLSGLLQSIERITDEGLRTADAPPAPPAPPQKEPHYTLEDIDALVRPHGLRVRRQVSTDTLHLAPREADAPPAPEVAASGSQGEGSSLQAALAPLPDAAAIRERIAICERCQMRVPERLVTYGIGVRGGTSARCAACAPQPGAIGDANRQEVIEIRRARSAPATTEGAGD